MYVKSLISWGFFSSEHFIHYHLLLGAHRRVSHCMFTRLKAETFPDPSGAYQVNFHPCQDVTAS